MNVLFLTSSPTPYKNPLIERLARHDAIDLFVCFCVWKSGTRPWELNPLEGVDYEVLRGIHLPVGGGNFVRFSLSIIGKLRTRKPDVAVVSGYNHPTMLLAIIYCILSRTPFLVQGETWKRNRGVLPRLKEWFIHPLLRRASGFLVTGALSREYWETVGIPSECIGVFANTPDIEYFENACRNLAEQDVKALRNSWQPGNRRVGIFVGRLIEPKGIDILLQAMRQLPDEARPMIVLVGDGSKKAEYEQLAKGLPVRFAGFLQQNDLPVAYAAADFFILPSRKEPWGVVVNEAMACGLPVLLSDQVGAYADLLDIDGQPNGVLAIGPTPDSVAASLESFVRTSRDELGRMSMRSIEIIRDWKYEKSVQNFVHMCRRAAGQDSPITDKSSPSDETSCECV